MKKKEKILRVNIREATDKVNHIVGGVPFAHWKYAIHEERMKILENCQNELDKYLNNKGLKNDNK